MVDNQISAIRAIVHIAPAIIPLVAAIIEIVPTERLVEMAIAIPMERLIESRPAMWRTMGKVCVDSHR